MGGIVIIRKGIAFAPDPTIWVVDLDDLEQDCCPICAHALTNERDLGRCCGRCNVCWDAGDPVALATEAIKRFQEAAA